jgi:hypothetical protein
MRSKPDRRTVIAAAVGMGAVALSRGAAAAPDVSFGFVYDDARLWVPVRVPEAPTPSEFVLDSGAASMVMDAGFAKDLGLSATGAESQTGAGAGSTTVSHLSDRRFSIGGMPLRASNVLVTPLDQLLTATSGRQPRGIVGAQLFQEHVVEVDFGARMVRLHDPKRFVHRGPGVIIPLRFVSGLPIARGDLTTPDGVSHGLDMVVDLGAKSTLLLAEPFIDKAALRQAMPRTVTARLGAGIGGPTRYAFARAGSVSLGAARLDRPVVGLSVDGVLKGGWFDGLLGAEFLSRFTPIFDYARERLILAPGKGPATAAEFDMSGLFVTASGPALRTYTVEEVQPGSPAAQAGVRVGDRITAVDGQDAARLSLGQLRERLKRGPDQVVTLAVARDGAASVLSVALRRLL